MRCPDLNPVCTENYERVADMVAAGDDLALLAERIAGGGIVTMGMFRSAAEQWRRAALVIDGPES